MPYFCPYLAWTRCALLALIQTHMAQKPMLRVEVGALRAHQVKNMRGGEGWVGANVQGACVGGCGYFGPGWASH